CLKSRGRGDSNELFFADGDDILHCFGRLEIDRSETRAIRWCSKDSAVKHARPRNVGGEFAWAGNNAVTVWPWRRMTKALPLFDRRKGGLRRYGLIESLHRFVVLGEVGVGERTFRDDVNNFAVVDFAVFGFDVPFLGRVIDQELTRGGGALTDGGHGAWRAA